MEPAKPLSAIQRDMISQRLLCGQGCASIVMQNELDARSTFEIAIPRPYWRTECHRRTALSSQQFASAIAAFPSKKLRNL